MKVAEYEYYDPSGELLLCVKARYKTNDPRGKTFSWYQPNPDAHGWISGRPPEGPDLLYRLPQVRAAVRAGDDVFWCEGEKDADTVTRLGGCGTSHPDGAMKVRPAHAQWFRGCTGRVVLLFDNDPPGAACVLRRLRELDRVGVRPEQIALLHSPYADCKDVTDHVAGRHSLDELAPGDVRALAAEARKVTPTSLRRYGYAAVTA